MQRVPFFEQDIARTPIIKLKLRSGNNEIYIKRDDMIPFSFGGNKARKAAEFYREIAGTPTDVIVTYGSNSSNHCRIIANMAYAMGIGCHVISPEENRTILYNTKLVEQFGATIEICPVTEVSATIDRRLEAYRKAGKHPYFIMGGGHGNPGTEAYVKAYREILAYEQEEQFVFDYIFHASGTGATQAGLVCGKLLESRNADQEQGAGNKNRIVGISIARPAERGREVVKDSIREYLGEKFEELYREDELTFPDDYRCGGYGNYDEAVSKTIAYMMAEEGIPMDTTYVGKAFTGMLKYLEDKNIQNSKLLFIHTGGTPLFFDRLEKQGEAE